MNILPKKRWHVRTRENIARVRRDEAAAAEEEKKRQQKIQLAEKEAKRDLLRTQARCRFPGAKEEVAKTEEPAESKPDDVSLIGSNGHVNLFYELEQTDLVSDKKNEEHEKEAKEEREKEEMKIGYLTYLGQDTNELTGQVSWYNLPPRRPVEKPLAAPPEPAPKPPLPAPEPSTTAEHIYTSILPPAKSRKAKKKKKSKKRKKERKILRLAKKIIKKREKRKKRRRSSSSSSSSSDSDEWVAQQDVTVVEERKTTDEDIEKMRAERLKREQIERARAAMLLARLRGEETTAPAETASPPPYTAKYNSQFNPELARQNYPA